MDSRRCDRRLSERSNSQQKLCSSRSVQDMSCLYIAIYSEQSRLKARTVNLVNESEGKMDSGRDRCFHCTKMNMSTSLSQ